MTPPKAIRWTTPEKRADALCIGLLAIVWIALVLVANPRGDFPINDDWIYAGAARSIAQTGRYIVPGPGSPNLIVQAYWGAALAKLFGFSYLILDDAARVIGFAGALGLYALIRDNGASPKFAAVCSLTLACNPSYFVSANSFMTDVPFLSLSILSVLCLIRGMRSDALAWIGTGLFAAFLSIGIRQFGFAILLAYAVAYPLRRGPSVSTIGAGVAPLLAAIGFELLYQRWLAATGRTPTVVYNYDNMTTYLKLAWIPIGSIAYSTAALVWVAILTLPILLFARKEQLRSMRRLAMLRAFAIVALLFAVGGVVFYRSPFFSRVILEYLIEFGASPLTLRDIYWLNINIPEISASVMVEFASVIISGFLGAAAILQILMKTLINCIHIERRKDFTWNQIKVITLISLGSSYWLLLLVLLLRNGDLFERYLLFFIPIVALGALYSSRPDDTAPGDRGAILASYTAVFVLALFTAAIAHDYFAWNRTRWAALTDLMAEGIAPISIDGGYEFNGAHKYELGKLPNPWGESNEEYLVTFGPVPGYEPLRRYAVDHWLPFTPSHIFILRRTV